jgi:hypothetical protein
VVCSLKTLTLHPSLLFASLNETNITFCFRDELNILLNGKDGVKSEYACVTEN